MTRSPQIAILKSCLKAAGGLEKQTHRLASEFCSFGYDVTILTTGWENKVSFPYKIKNVSTVKKSSIQSLFSFNKECRKWLDQNKCTLVFGLDRNPWQTHYRAGNGVHATYLKRRALTETSFKYLSLYLNPRHQLFLKMERQLFNEARLKRLFVNSHMVAKEMTEEYSVCPKKISIIHNGVEWHEMDPAFQKWEIGKKEISDHYRLKNEQHQFLFVGKGFRRKGLQFLLQGLREITPHHYHLSVVGDDREIEYFSSLAKKWNLSVTFFGKADPIPFYQLADTLCIPSTYDPFANVTVEALAMGIPVITSKFNGGKEVLTKETGHVVETLTDPASFAEALKSALLKKKTVASSEEIRESVRYLDFSRQMKAMVDQTLESVHLEALQL